MIRRGRIAAHRRCMLAAFAASSLFLVSYVVYHAQAGSRPFTGQGPVRAVYFAILISHVLLAAAIVPLALVTLRAGAARRLRAASADRAMDVPGVDVRVGDRGRDLLDALPALTGVEALGGRRLGGWASCSARWQGRKPLGCGPGLSDSHGVRTRSRTRTRTRSRSRSPEPGARAWSLEPPAYGEAP